MTDIELRNENGKIVGYDQNGTKVPVSYESLDAERFYSESQAADVVVYESGGTFYADGGGGPISSGSDAGVVIQAAIDALSSSGGLVCLGTGTYEISSSLDLSDNFETMIVGRGGSSTTLKLADGANVDVITDDRATSADRPNNIIGWLQIDGNKSNNSAGRGIYFDHTSDNRVVDVEIKNCPESGIYLEPHTGRAENNRFSRLDIHKCQNGIYVTAKDNNIENCFIYENVDDGIHVDSASSLMVNQCGIYANGRNNIFMTSNSAGALDDVTVIGGAIDWSGGDSVVFSDDTKRCKLIGAKLYHNGTDSGSWAHIKFESPNGGWASSNIIMGCVFHESTADIDYSVDLSGANGPANLVMGCQLASGVPINTRSNNADKIRHNLGFTTENNGSGSVSDGGTIAHGLGITPSLDDVSVRTASTNRAYATAVDGTDITVALEDPSGSSVGTAETVYFDATIR